MLGVLFGLQAGKHHTCFCLSSLPREEERKGYAIGVLRKAPSHRRMAVFARSANAHISPPRWDICLHTSVDFYVVGFLGGRRLGPCFIRGSHY